MPTLTLTVQAGTDDAKLNDIGYSDTDTSILLGSNGSGNPTNGGQGLRFQGVNLGPNDVINSAMISVMKSTATWQNVDWRLTAIDEDNTAAFSSGSPPGARNIVSGSIASETLNINHADGTVYTFPSTSGLKSTLAAAIAAVLDRAGWVSGNALAIVNQSYQDAGHTNNFSREQYHTYESTTASSEPQLIIDYTAAPAAIDQEGFRFRNDDGSESAATWKAAQDTNVTLPASSSLRLRLLLNSPEDPGSQQYRLDFKKSSDSNYVAVDNPPAATLAYGAEGAVAVSAASATSVTPAYPTGITTRSILLMIVGQKPTTANADQVTTPSGWTLIGSLTAAGGYSTTLGADTGNTNLYVYAKDTVAGTETGTVTVTITNTSTTGVTWAQILRIESPVDLASRLYAAATTSQTATPTSPMTLTFGSDPGVTAGDYVVAAMCIPTDVTTPAQFSSQSFSQTGITFGTVTEVSEPDSNTGNDIGGVIVRAAVSSGTSSAAPQLTMTLAGTLTNVRGPAIFVRVRGTPVQPAIQLSPSSNIAAGGSTATTAQLTPPSGKTTSNFTAGNISDDTNPTPAIDIASNGYTEIEWSIQTHSSTVNGDVYQFRVTVGGTALSSYGITPQLTIGTGTITASATFVGGGALSATPVFTTSVSFAGTSSLSATPVFRSSATFAGTGTLSATPVFVANVTFAGSSALSATPILTSPVSVTINGSGALSATPVFAASVSFAGASTLTATPVFRATISFVGSGALAATPVFVTSAAFAGVGALSATNPVFAASVTFAGAGTLTASYNYSAPINATFNGSSTFTASNPVFLTSASFAGASSVTAAPVFTAAATFAGSGQLTATPVFNASVSFVGAGTLTATPVLITPASVQIDGASSLSATATYEGPAGAVVEGGSTLTATPILTTPASATFAGTGSLTAAPVLITTASVTLASTGILSVLPILIKSASATFAGVGTLSVSAIQLLTASANFAGASSLVVNPTSTIVASGIFIGGSTVTAVPSILAIGSVVIASAGTLTATYSYVVVIPASANFAGSSTFVILSFAYSSSRPAFAYSYIAYTAFTVTRVQQTAYAASRQQQTAHATTLARRS